MVRVNEVLLCFKSRVTLLWILDKYLVETKQNINLQTKANFLENDSRTDALIVPD